MPTEKKHDLVLVTLDREQIAKAKHVNGKRKRITHALICGPYGQIFGTKQQCLKYFAAWDPRRRWEVAPSQWRAGMFPNLFAAAVETDQYEILDYKTTFNLVIKLIALDEACEGN